MTCTKRIIAARLYLTSRSGQRGKESNGGGSHIETACCGHSCQVFVSAYALSKEFGLGICYTEFATWLTRSRGLAFLP